ncbi:hypothetical protein PS655_06053 [Pseudomonas fluorescens]|uniref:Uncharacterized protein n=1 Tax=Pseudomonas fluorescens TaxID=294 RepID=A0A5E6Y3W3_PSEFL|nr:hypothetical protein PS655_06053 [Pseudomonas fluorescens]
MQADDPRPREQLRQAQIARAQRQYIGVRERIVGQQLAAETVHDFREGRTNLTGADNPDGFANQVETGQTVQAEIAFTGAVIGAVQTTVEGQDQRHGVFGHRMRRVGRYAYHGQSETFRRGQIDMVVTGRAQGNQACAASGQSLEYRCAKVVVDKRTDHFMRFSQRRRIEAEPGWLKVQFDTRRAIDGEEAVAVVGLATENDRAHENLLEHRHGLNHPSSL